MQSVKDVMPAGSQEGQRNNKQQIEKFGSLLINYNCDLNYLF